MNLPREPRWPPVPPPWLDAARDFVTAEAQAVLDISEQIDESFVRAAALLLHSTGRSW